MHDEIIVVSGLPRSGTSMVMKMLDAGGLSVATDNVRKPDDDNPKGYFEYEKVKELHKDAGWLGQMKGKCIKIISHLLYSLPPELEYRVIFIRRNMKEILASQARMYERLQKASDNIDDAVLAQKFNAHLAKVSRWLNQRENIACLFVNHGKILQDPAGEGERISAFIGQPMDAGKMAAVVDPKLYRNRVM